VQDVCEDSHQRHKIVSAESGKTCSNVIFSQHNIYISESTSTFSLIFNDERRTCSACDSMPRLEI